MRSKSIFVAAIMYVIAFNSITQAVTIATVPVGNAGNADDNTGYGGVAYEYQIGKYEVTAGQYAEFLNTVAATDTYGLYNMFMDSSEHGCQITRNGTDGSYTYDFSGRPSGTEADWANRPVNYVSWYDTLRFTNWLHNGQPTGGQTAATTEDGAYDMSLGSSVVRKAEATVWLPNEDEWYKAAYHKNDGITDNYFIYPTSSNSIPSNDLIGPDPGNNATFYDGEYTIDSPYYHTEVGAHENSDSPYGTFDMGGNIWEWNETLISGSNRGLRGGTISLISDTLKSSYRYDDAPYVEDIAFGFRVAAVTPEPATLLLFGLGVTMLRRRK